MATITERFARNLRTVLDAHGVTQRDIGEVINRSQSQVSARLAGRVPFQMDEAELIAAYLDIPLSELVPFEDATA